VLSGVRPGCQPSAAVVRGRVPRAEGGDDVFPERQRHRRPLASRDCQPDAETAEHGAD